MRDYTRESNDTKFICHEFPAREKSRKKLKNIELFYYIHMYNISRIYIRNIIL